MRAKKLQKIISKMYSFNINSHNEYCDNLDYKISIISCDVKKIHDSWKNDYYYIEFDDSIKMKKSLIDLLNLSVDRPSTILLNDDFSISFEDGRHRFINLMNMGCKKLPFIVYEIDKKAICENYA